MSWMKVHAVFYDAARAEWSQTGWEHHMGKNTLINFQTRVKERMGDRWNDVLIPEVQKLYFKVRAVERLT